MEQAILVAIQAKFGIRISVSDQTSGKALFYKTRKELIAKGITLATFVSCATPPNAPNELWLVKKGLSDAEET